MAHDVIPRLKPDFVVVGLFVNDFEDVLVSDAQFRDSIGFGRPDPGHWKQWLRLPHLRRWIEVEWTDRFAERVLGQRDQRRWYFGAFAVFERGRAEIETEGARLVEQHLRQIQERADREGAEMLVLLLPAPLQVVGADELDELPSGVDRLDPERFDPERPQRLAHEIGRRRAFH